MSTTAKRDLPLADIASTPTDVAPVLKKLKLKLRPEASEFEPSVPDNLTASDIGKLPLDKLVLYVTTLKGAYQELVAQQSSIQQELKDLKGEIQQGLQGLTKELMELKEPTNASNPKTSGGLESSKSLNEAEVKVREIAKIMGEEIRKQLEWQ